jgi:mercuric ion transport protein
MRWKEHLDKAGIVGSFLAAACCLGLPVILSLVTALGLGFLINDSVLKPLMIVFLGLTLAGQFSGYLVHRRLWPMLLAGVCAVAAYLFVFVRAWKAAAYLAILGLVAASIINGTLRSRCAPACES